MRRLALLVVVLLVSACSGTPPASAPASFASASPIVPVPTVTPTPIPTAIPTPLPSPSRPATPSQTNLGPTHSPATASCEFPTTVLVLSGQDPASPLTRNKIVSCLGQRAIEVTGWLGDPDFIGWGSPRIEPAWLGDMFAIGKVLWLKPPPTADPWCATDTDCVWLNFTSPHASELPLAPDRWVTVTGHFDDPAAATCRWVGPEGPYSPPLTRAEAVALCRNQFVVTAIDDTEPPVGSTASP